MINKLIPARHRVLMSTDTAGGVWDYSLELAAGLRRHGFATILAALGAPLKQTQREAALLIPDLVLKEFNCKLEWMLDAGKDVNRSGEWLLELNASFSPDIVHLNSYGHASLPWGRPTVVTAHSCILSWWINVRGESAPQTYCKYAEMVAQGLAAPDRLVFITNALRSCMESIYGAKRDSVVIYNGRDPFKYRSAAKERFIFSAGRLWDEAKNIFILEKVASDLKWPVIVAGNSVSPDGEGQFLSKISHLGFLSSAEMAEMFGKAGIFALPARYEPFGLAILEAALAGCALVLGDIPTLRELWEGAAVFVDPNDPTRLRDILRLLIDDMDKVISMGRKAHSRALFFSSETMCLKYSHHYRKLLNDKARTYWPAAGREPKPAAGRAWSSMKTKEIPCLEFQGSRRGDELQNEQ